MRADRKGKQKVVDIVDDEEEEFVDVDDEEEEDEVGIEEEDDESDDDDIDLLNIDDEYNRFDH